MPRLFLCTDFPSNHEDFRDLASLLIPPSNTNGTGRRVLLYDICLSKGRDKNNRNPKLASSKLEHAFDATLLSTVGHDLTIPTYPERIWQTRTLPLPEHKALQDAGRVDLRRDNTKIVAGMTRGYTRRYFSALHLPRNTHIEGARILNHFDFSRRTSRSLPTSCKRWCTGKKTVASVHFICIASQYTLQECPRCVCTEFFVSVTLPFAGSEAQQVVSRILGDSGHNVVSR